MKRKEFITTMTRLGGVVLLSPTGLLDSCSYKPIFRTKISENDIPFLDDIAETIIPETADSPGAKAAKTGRFINIMARDCMPLEQQLVLVEGINALDKFCAEQHKSSFIKLEAFKKRELVQQLQLEAIAQNLKEKGKTDPTPHYFELLKKNTIDGYFSSKIGCTQARRYNPIPGKFEACIPYKKEDRIWAT